MLVLQESVVEPPVATDVGFAAKFTVGCGVDDATVTVADWLALEVALVQVSVYVRL